MNYKIPIIILIIVIILILNKNESFKDNNEFQMLINNEMSDKDTIHSYLPLYYQLLKDKKYTAKNVLEIGIQRGGSIKLWSEYFKNATVYGVDIIDINDPQLSNEIKNKQNIKLFTSVDAYSKEFVSNEFKNIKFDFILDDGPHTLESMKKCINLYLNLLTPDGILIIEDVQSWDWLDILKNEVPDNLKNYIKYYDLRKNKNRYDDIVFVLNKNN